MPLYAIEDVDDALAATRAFLLPFDARQWLKLALLAFFVGGTGANAGTVSSSVSGDGGPPAGPPGPPGLPDGVPGAVPERALALVAAAVAAVLVVGLLYAAVAAVFEFVLVESLRAERVAVRRFWGRRWRQGLRLFGFRLALGFATAVLVAGLVGLAVVPFLDGRAGPLAAVAVLVAAPLSFALVLFAGVVSGFTTMFVVPVMVLRGGGVLAGWRRLWRSVAAEPRQYVAYALVGFALALAGGVLVGVVAGLVALLVVVPFGVLAAVAAALFGAPAPVAVVVVLGVAFLLSLLVAAAVVRVPVMVYLRYYALLVLGDVDPGLDLVGDRRAAVRE